MYLSIPFKHEFKFEQRLLEAKRVVSKYPDRVPIICERSLNASSGCPIIDKRKYLVPRDLTMGQFLYVIRRRLKLSQDKALFLFIHNKIPASTSSINYIYESYKDNDCYLYVSYDQENTFG